MSEVSKGLFKRVTKPTSSGRTILFADIVGSTALYESLGNRAAQERVAGCLGMLVTTAQRFEGRVVKSLGDGILCSFEGSQSAVTAALSMCSRSSEHSLDLRIGLHHGEVVEEGGDVFGDAVNTASRIADLAKPKEVLISADLKRELPNFLPLTLRSVPPVSLKGKQAPIELFTILQEPLLGSGPGDQTIVNFTLEVSSVARPTEPRLHLSHGERVISMHEELELLIGREDGCSICVPSPHVSRKHARVYWGQGKFMLADHSANGTFLVPAGQPKLHLVREQIPIHGSGVIYPGADPDTGAVDPIYYHTST